MKKNHQNARILTYSADLVPITAYEVLSKRELQNSIIQARVDDCVDGLLVQLETYVAAMPTKRIIVDEQWPATWWEAIRERWFPRWWLQKYPIRYKRIALDQQLYGAACPHLPYEPKAKHLKFLASSLPPGGVINGECHDRLH